MTPESLSKSGSEFGEQTALFCWCNSGETRRRFPHFYDSPREGENIGRCKLYSTNNNAGVSNDKKTAAIRGARAKQIGLKPGVADIFLPLARHGVRGLYLELKIDPNHPVNLKSKRKGITSESQKHFGQEVIKDGFGWVVCEGYAAAIKVLIDYLGD